jgi:hypothetical protein
MKGTKVTQIQVQCTKWKLWHTKWKKKWCNNFQIKDCCRRHWRWRNGHKSYPKWNTDKTKHRNYWHELSTWKPISSVLMEISWAKKDDRKRVEESLAKHFPDLMKQAFGTSSILFCKRNSKAKVICCEMIKISL